MSCVILIHAKNWQQRNRILASLDDDISSEVIVDLKKYAEQKYKGRFVPDEEIGGGGNSTQMVAVESVGVENKEVPLLEEMTRNSQMIATEGNAPTNANADVKRENDNEQSVEPEVKNEPVVVAEGPHSNTVDNIPPIDDDLSSTTNINNTNAALDDELPLYAYLNAYTDDVPMDIQENDSHTNEIGVDVPCLERDVTDGGAEDVSVNDRSGVAPIDDVPVTSITDEPSTSTKRRSESSAKRSRYARNDEESNEKDVDKENAIVDNGSENSPKENTESSSIDNVPSTSTIRRSSRVPKRTACSINDKNGDDHAQPTKSIAKPQQQPASKKQKSVNDSPDGSDVVSVIDSSTKTRSGKIVKKPRYATDSEESDEEDDDPVPVKVKPATRVQPRKKKAWNKRVKTGIKCQLCLKKLHPQYRSFSKLKEHSVIHTGLKRYKCSVKGCTYKSGPCMNVRLHIKNVHKVSSFKPKYIHLTNEQEEELDQVTKECFPGFGTGKEYKVCDVCQKAVLNKSLNQQRLKHHSLTHIDFMLYTCNQQNCQYESKYYNLMTIHLRNKHGIEEMSKEETEIELTDDQKKEINDMLERCFPNEDENVDE